MLDQAVPESPAEMMAEGQCHHLAAVACAVYSVLCLSTVICVHIQFEDTLVSAKIPCSI